MNIEHSPLLNEFISFWFETRVDGELKYETMLDFTHFEWRTSKAVDERHIVLRGKLDSTLTEDEMVEQIKPSINSAILAQTI